MWRGSINPSRGLAARLTNTAYHITTHTNAGRGDFFKGSIGSFHSKRDIIHEISNLVTLFYLEFL